MSFKQSLKSIGLSLVLVGVTITAEADGHAKQYIFPFDEVNWLPAGVEGAEYQILWGEASDASAVYAYRLQPGAVIPLHTHPNDYYGLSVQGRWIHIDADGNEEITDQGQFVLIRGGLLHGDSCAGPDVCINIVDSIGPSVTVFQ